MKKLKSVLVVLSILCLFITGCGNKKSITAKEFKSILEQEKFEVIDMTKEVTNDDIVKIYIAVDSNKKYQFVFYETRNSSLVKELFTENQNSLESRKHSGYAETTLSLFNYNKYTLNTGGYYFVVSRINNTLVLAQSTSKDKKHLQAILKKIGY